MEGSLSVATLNVRGLAASQVHRLSIDEDIDVLAVQETKVDGEEETEAFSRRVTTLPKSRCLAWKCKRPLRVFLAAMLCAGASATLSSTELFVCIRAKWIGGQVRFF